jgi:hypothetical protein
MIFESLVKPGVREKIIQRWMGRPFMPESFHYYGPPNAFIINKVMLNHDIVARGVLPEHLAELVAKISKVEWATLLVLQVCALNSEARPFRATLAGRYIE